jgi:RNA polymerase sigma factor (sigma-70 family)
MPDAPEAYVRRSIANAYVSRQRRHRVTEELVAMVPEVGQAKPPDSLLEQNDAVDGLLAGLSPRQRAVLVLRYREDWSEAQIAEALRISAGSVKSLASRGLSALRERLISREESPS